MYHLQLYSDSYTPHAGFIEVDSNTLPRAGDVVEANGGDTFVVFDITHILQDGRCMTVVRAREAARVDRFYVLSENGYLDTREDLGSGDWGVSLESWNAAFGSLPQYRNLPD